MPDCKVCGNNIEGSLQLNICAFHQGITHLECCKHSCSWHGKPCEHSAGVYNRNEE